MLTKKTKTKTVDPVMRISSAVDELYDALHVYLDDGTEPATLAPYIDADTLDNIIDLLSRVQE
jgi:hypothetical protein